MSVVTDIILTTAVDDGAEREDEHPNADKLNAWLEELTGRPGCLVKVDQLGNGNKAMQCDVFVCAINYLPYDDFVEAFRAIQWERPGSANLSLKGEDDDGFTLYGVDPRFGNTPRDKLPSVREAAKDVLQEMEIDPAAIHDGLKFKPLEDLVRIRRYTLRKEGLL